MQDQGRVLRLFRIAILLFSFLVIFAPVGRAQNASATLQGVVQDAGGGRIPLAEIDLRSAASSSLRQATTDTRGEFRLDSLQPGTYHVVINASGFAQATSDVTVVVSATRDLTVTMQPSTMRQTVNVQGQASSITTQPIDTT